MDKKQLAKAIAKKTKSTEQQALLFIDAFTATVRYHLSRRNRPIRIRGFGRFEKVEHKAKRTFVPGDPEQGVAGRYVDTPVRRHAKFKPYFTVS